MKTLNQNEKRPELASKPGSSKKFHNYNIASRRKGQEPLFYGEEYMYINHKTTIDNAKYNWPEILGSLGIDKRYLMNKHGPCPVCGGKDRFRFDDQGEGKFICNRCGSGDGIRLLMLFHKCNYRKAIKMVAGRLGAYGYDSNPAFYSRVEEPVYKANGIYSRELRNHTRVCGNKKTTPGIDNTGIDKSINVKYVKNIEKILLSSKRLSKGDPADLYLRNRGINLDIYPESLCYCPNLPYYDDGKFVDSYPALIAIILDPHDQTVSLQRIYLNKSGGEAQVSLPKKNMPPIYKGALTSSAIRLFEPANGTLAIAEGVVTALSFYVATGTPVWAAVSAHGLESVILPPTILDVIILVDNDVSGTGQKAALVLSQRLLNEKRRVRRYMPSEVGADFNDVLLEKNDEEGSHDC